MPDWKALEDAATAQLIAAVRRVRADRPNDDVGPGHQVGARPAQRPLPLAVLIRPGARGVGGRHDPVYTRVPGEVESTAAEHVHAEAAERGGFAAWEEAYKRFLRVFPKAARRAREELIADGTVGPEFIAIADDEEGELIPLSLTDAQLSRHFPDHSPAS